MPEDRAKYIICKQCLQTYRVKDDALAQASCSGPNWKCDNCHTKPENLKHKN